MHPLFIQTFSINNEVLNLNFIRHNTRGVYRSRNAIPRIFISQICSSGQHKKGYWTCCKIHLLGKQTDQVCIVIVLYINFRKFVVGVSYMAYFIIHFSGRRVPQGQSCEDKKLLLRRQVQEPFNRKYSKMSMNCISYNGKVSTFG